MGALVILAAFGFFYFLPTVVGRNKRSFGLIFALNVLLGWTVIGWVAALVWAILKDATPAAVSVPVLSGQPAQGSAILCASCGIDSTPASEFCTTCGKPSSAMALQTAGE